MPARRILSAADLQHGDGDVRRRRDQPHGRRDQLSACSAQTPAGAPQTRRRQTTCSLGRRKPASWPVYVAIALSGACALGAEVIWTRLMGMLLLATVYVFSIILAVFLIGLAVGSAAASWLLHA